ncbi:MAG: hypothetical protein QOK40_3160 [Miltoncostaeaceae bacterium]|nr:hypothetical protein [Miltoncostaeaceae bacterium]
MSGWGAVTWDAARAGGFTALGLLSLSVMVGLLLSLRLASPRWPRFLTNEVHRFLSLLGLIFIGIHLVAVWLDPFTRFGLAEVLVPLASHYRPLWMGLGIVALYLAVAVWVTTLLRRRIGYSAWRRLHGLAFAVYGAALVHGLATGSDTRTAWAEALYVACALMVALPFGTRLLRRAGPGGRRRPLLAAGTAGALVLGIAWAVSGPLRPGWNARANDGQGSGARVTIAVPVAPAAPGRAGVPADPFQNGFSAQLTGQVEAGSIDRLGYITLRLGTVLRGRVPGLLEVVLHGLPTEGGGVRIATTAATRVLLGTRPSAPLYQGQLATLAGNQMTALVRRSSPSRSLRLHVALEPIRQGHVVGTVWATPQSIG